MKEHDIYTLIADYLRYQYPTVIYRFDLAADLKLTMGQARKHKRLQRYRGYPDLFIAEPRQIHTQDADRYAHGVILGQADTEIGKFYAVMVAGLFLEIKKPGTRILKKDGTIVADAHIREQYGMLEDLRAAGYAAEFACGYEEAKKIIDEYMKGKYEHID